MKSALPLVWRGLDNEFTGDEVERAHHGDLLRLARGVDAQIGSSFRPGAGEIGMGQRLRFIGEQQHDVARQRLLFHQLKTQTGSLYGLGVLPAFQRVAGALAGEAPHMGFCLSRGFTCALRALLWQSDPKREPVFAMQP
jgi:hypothetical protein